MKSIVFFVLLFFGSLFPQDGTFEKIYSQGTGYDVKEMPDGGYVVGATSFDTVIILKTDKHGNLLWRKKSTIFNARSVHIEVTDNNEILFTGYVNDNKFDIVLVKLDKNGNQLWQKTFGTAEYGEFGFSISKLTDGNFLLVAGQNNGANLSFSKVLLYKLDLEGNLIWQKTLTLLASIYLVQSKTQMISLRDGNLVLLVSRQLFKISTNGDIVFEIQLPYKGYGICEAEGGDIIVATQSSLVKYSSTGKVVIAKYFSTNYSDVGVSPSSETGYYIFYHWQFATLINENLDTVFVKRFNGEINSLITTHDHHHVFVGSDFPQTIWMCKTDSSLNYKSLRFSKSSLTGKYKFGDEIELNWYHAGTSGRISIEFSSDNGRTWIPIVSSIIDSGIYKWIPPGIISSECKFRISDPENPSFNAVTDTYIIYPNTDQDYINANNIFMWLQNDGRSSHDPRTESSGLYWPADKYTTAVFQDGLIWGGKVNGEIRVNGSCYRTGLKAGNMNSLQEFSDPQDVQFGIWKMKKDWEQSSGIDYLRYKFNFENWPGQLGAPYEDVDRDGKYSSYFDLPKIIGDEMLWFVANDADTVQSQYTYGSLPIGIELQCTVFAYNTVDYLKDVVFKKYILINKGNNPVEEMRLSYWSDPDLGNASDDFTGIDTTLQLSYCYNSDNNDEGSYGIAPPAVGYLYLQNPYISGSQSDSGIVNNTWRKGIVNLKIGANVPGLKLFDPVQEISKGALQWWNYLNGFYANGDSCIDPNTGATIKIALAGDPVTSTGWYEGAGWKDGNSHPPGDRRIYTATEPFTLAEGDTQEIVIAILLAKGTDNINSISELRNLSSKVREFYNTKFPLELKKTSYLPDKFLLYQNYPNPFNYETRITYQITKSTANVTLTVYDILGSKVTTLVNEAKQPGMYFITFDGSKLSSGVYFYKIEAGSFVQSKKMIILK